MFIQLNSIEKWLKGQIVLNYLPMSMKLKKNARLIKCEFLLITRWIIPSVISPLKRMCIIAVKIKCIRVVKKCQKCINLKNTVLGQMLNLALEIRWTVKRCLREWSNQSRKERLAKRLTLRKKKFHSKQASFWYRNWNRPGSYLFARFVNVNIPQKKKRKCANALMNTVTHASSIT